MSIKPSKLKKHIIGVLQPEEEPKFFCSIIKFKQLANIFNHYLNEPPSHAAPYWERIKTVINNEDTGTDITESEGIFLIKYLLVDTFGCVVPPFIDFQYKLKDKTKNDENNHVFEEIIIMKHDYTKNPPSQEVQSGW